MKKIIRKIRNSTKFYEMLRNKYNNTKKQEISEGNKEIKKATF